ncbi:hypothetical protein GGX14DRAFT_385658 [Mycena pura]|uniref:DDE Tnp4 domain-containing protein n=1 Tax=Mycena pura TaxID=153505 RepID=A0AAD6YR38_9AGAR|nr:hypothetical protein GGX14DRAFT_385658 [Mycena pura]
MDIHSFFRLSEQLVQLQEDEFDNSDQHLAGTGIAIILLGAINAHTRRIARRKQNRVYLCRLQLLPYPRLCSPWQVLYLSGSDRAYITTMGVDVTTFNYILQMGFADLWNSERIPRPDALRAGRTRPGAHSLDASGALGLVLHFLNSTMREISLQQIFALIPSTVSRYITFGMDLLLRVLRTTLKAAITWPATCNKFEEYNNLIIACHPRLTGAFASIDGLNLACQTSHNSKVENATYNGWLCEHFISSVFVFSPHGAF